MPYQEPKIDRNWRKDKVLHGRSFLAFGIVILLMTVALSLTVFKSCTGYGKAGKDDIYDPSVGLSIDEGFIGLSNTLFDTLLTVVDTNVEAIDLKSLNKRYPAIEFALPYGEDHQTVIEASDLRVVGIHPEYIKDKDLVDFYYNSRLPQLLNRQRDNMADTYFRITPKPSTNYNARNQTRPLDIEDIRVNSAMFKVALIRNPWTGTITANPSCLFPEGKTLYLAYGNTMLPLPLEEKESRMNNTTYRVDPTGEVLTDAKGSPIDYYEHYTKFFDPSNASRMTCAVIEFPLTGSRSDIEHYFSLCCTKDSMLHFRLAGAQLVVYDGQKEATTIDTKANINYTTSIPLVDGMKFIVYNADKTRKLGEFSLTTTDPTSTLSRLVQTQTGASRYTLAPTQTDLFTQQMVRALTQHLTNRTGVTNVDISLDPLLSREFEHEITSYLNAIRTNIDSKSKGWQLNPQYDISLTVLDLATGNVIAQPFYTTKFDNTELPEDLRLTTRNVALSRRYLGSTFKPILALAAVETDAGLLDLNLTTSNRYADENAGKAHFFGYTSPLWAKGSMSHWKTTCDFTTFISRSDDVYPVLLAGWALSGSRYTQGATQLPLTSPNCYFKAKGTDLYLRDDRAVSKATPFGGWLVRVTDANASSEDTSADSLLFRYLEGINNVTGDDLHFGIEEVSPDATNLHFDMLTRGENVRVGLAPWVLGQGSNEWSALQIATAWARMLSGHQIQASYILAPKGTTIPSLFADNGNDKVPESIYPANPTEASRRAIWTQFLYRFRDAQKTGWLNDMNTAIGTLNSQVNRTGSDQLVLFSKTGTPDGYSHNELPTIGGARRYFDIGLYTFGLMTESQLQRAMKGETPHGLVCAIRVTRTYQCKACDNPNRHNDTNGNGKCDDCDRFNGLSSTEALHFFSANPARLRKFYDMTRKYY